MSPEQQKKPERPKIYGLEDAAKYLKLTEAGLRYHIYEAKDLKEDGMLGGAIYFFEDTLDAFKKTKRRSGRPKKNKE